MPAHPSHTLKLALAWLAERRNALDYPLRQAFRWRRGGLRFPNEPKETLFAHLPAAERQQANAGEARLRAAYGLDGLYNSSRADNYRENLFYLELLERAFESLDHELPASLRAADIGPSHWFYVQALHALLRGWRCPAGRAVDLTGYEADAYRLYADFRSRCDHAQAHLRGLPGARYLPQAFASEPGRFDVITLLFPFVFQQDHREWGLPARLFDPAALLAAAWESLKPGGALVIVNQGEAEHQAQAGLLRRLGIPPRAAFCHTSRFYAYDLPRYVLAACRA